MALAAHWHRCQNLQKSECLLPSAVYRWRDDPVKTGLANWRTDPGTPGLVERRDTLANHTGGPAKCLQHGKWIPLLAKLTHIRNYLLLIVYSFFQRLSANSR